EIYAACAPLVQRSVEAVEPLLADSDRGSAIAWSGVAGLYVVGGGGLFPLVTRVLKERFGEKRVRRSPPPFDAIFPKGTIVPAPGAAPVSVTRRYRAAHNVGHFRFLECTRLTGDRPDGD